MLPSLSGARLNSKDLGRLLGVSRPTALAYLHTLEETGLLTRVPFCGGGKRPLLIAWEDPSPLASLLYCLRDLGVDCRFYRWERRTRVVDLIADLGNERVGFSFSSAERLKHRDWMPLTLAIDRKVIDRGFVLHAGDRVVRNLEWWIFGLPSRLFLRQAQDWMFTWRDRRESWQAMVRINRATAAARDRAAGYY